MTSEPVDRFICAREGHIPVVRFTSMKASGMPAPTVYITACARCGRMVEFPIPPDDEALAGDAE